MNFEIFLESIYKAMADRGKKMGKTKILKLEYLENKKRFLY